MPPQGGCDPSLSTTAVNSVVFDQEPEVNFKGPLGGLRKSREQGGYTQHLEPYEGLGWGMECIGGHEDGSTPAGMATEIIGLLDLDIPVPKNNNLLWFSPISAMLKLL